MSSHLSAFSSVSSGMSSVDYEQHHKEERDKMDDLIASKIRSFNKHKWQQKKYVRNAAKLMNANMLNKWSSQQNKRKNETSAE